MSFSLIAAGGLGLAVAFLLWRLSQANKTIGRLKTQIQAKDAAYAQLEEQTGLLSKRIADLGGAPPDGVLVDDEGRIRRP